MPQVLLYRIVYPVIAGLVLFAIEVALRSHGGSAAEVASNPKTAIAPVAVAMGGAAMGPHHMATAVAGAKALMIAAVVLAGVCVMMLLALLVVGLPFGM